MSDEQEIRDLVARYADAVNRRDVAQFEATWAPEATWIIDPPTDIRSSGPRDEIAAAFEAALHMMASFLQFAHATLVEVDGDCATARSYLTELGIPTGGATGYLNYGVYSDTLIRTTEGWRFAERHYQYLYVDDAPLSGRAAPVGRVL